jgi:hypothetical protein
MQLRNPSKAKKPQPGIVTNANSMNFGPRLKGAASRRGDIANKEAKM